MFCLWISSWNKHHCKDSVGKVQTYEKKLDLLKIGKNENVIKTINGRMIPKPNRYNNKKHNLGPDRFPRAIHRFLLNNAHGSSHSAKRKYKGANNNIH